MTRPGKAGPGPRPFAVGQRGENCYDILGPDGRAVRSGMVYQADADKLCALLNHVWQDGYTAARSTPGKDASR